MAFECDYEGCRREFDSEKGKKIHMTNTHVEKKWRDEEYLRKEYLDKRKSTPQIAEECGCSDVTVQNALKDHGIERRKNIDYDHVTSPGISVNYKNERGYRVLTASNCGGESPDKVYVHRFLMLMEHDPDEISGKHVHHKNGCKFDNRIENLELKDPSEHHIDHKDGVSDFERRLCAALYEQGITAREIGEILGYSRQTVDRYTGEKDGRNLSPQERKS
jgi:biotin operon repressor